MFDSAIQNIFHFSPSWIDHNAPVAQGPGAELQAPLIQPDNLSFGDPSSRLSRDLFFTQLRNPPSAAVNPFTFQRISDLRSRIFGSPIGMIDDKRSRLF